jgi:hypothetical protein
MTIPLLVVDAANVVARLRDNLAGLAAGGLPGLPAPVEVVLVTEGKARGTGSVPGVRVIGAPGSGDDAIVELVAAEGPGRRVVVVTADRGLRDRVAGLGAEVRGPSSVPR